MTTPNLDIEIIQGALFRLVFTYTDVAGVPVTFEGQSFKMMVRADLDAKVESTSSTQNGLITHDPLTGRFEITIPARDTMKYTLEDSGVYDLYSSGIDASARRLVKGNVQFSRAVTR